MIELKNVVKTYSPKRGPKVTALKGVSLKLDDLGLVFVLGKSGCGKSTLLNCIGGLDRIDSGEIIINGKSSANFSQSDFDSYRNTYLGFIFQEYNIIQEFTVGANIGLALEIQGKKATNEAINAILAEVELENYGSRKPNELSGGQKQRVAIARALVKSPEIILADEPTGALDSKTGIQVFDTLKHLSKTRLVLVVSHDREFAEQYADRIITLADGVVIDDVQKNSEAAQQVASGFNIIKDSIIHIKKGYELTDKDLILIKNYIKNSEHDTVISLDQKANENMRKAANITEEGVNVFKETKEEKLALVEGKSFHSIRSRLPLKDSFKIGASAFKNKKFRLVMTILLSVFAFVLFALTDTMAVFNMDKALASSIHDAKIAHLTYQKYIVYEQLNDEGELVRIGHMDSYNEQDLQTLSGDDIVGIPMKGVYIDDYLSSSITTNLFKPFDYTSFYSYLVCGFMDADQNYLNNLGFTLAGNYPDKPNEIVITDYIFQTFAEFEYKENASGNKINIDTYQDILGKTIYLGKTAFTIVGVVNTGFNKNGEYNILKEEDTEVLGKWIMRVVTRSSMQSALMYGYHGLVFGAEGFVEHLREQYDYTALSTSGAGGSSSLSFKIIAENGWSSFLNYILKLSDIEGEIEWKDGVERTVLAANEILLPKSMKDEAETSYNLVQTFYGKETSDEYTVVGYFDMPTNALPNEYDTAWVVNDGLYQKYYNQSLKIYSLAIGHMPATKGAIQDALDIGEKIFDGANYKVQNEIIVGLDLFDFIFSILKDVFVYLGAAFAVFASFQFANYIGVSITYKKKDIGILRAIGARGADVYGIFFAESLIIAGISFAISAFLSAVISVALNLAVHRAGLHISILNFGIRQILLLILICVSVAAVASFLPVFNLARKKPIDTINER